MRSRDAPESSLAVGPFLELARPGRQPPRAAGVQARHTFGGEVKVVVDGVEFVEECESQRPPSEAELGDEAAVMWVPVAEEGQVSGPSRRWTAAEVPGVEPMSN